MKERVGIYYDVKKIIIKTIPQNKQGFRKMLSKWKIPTKIQPMFKEN